MAARFASQTKPSPEGPPWLYGIVDSSFFQSELNVQLIRLRADHDASAETCVKLRRRRSFTVSSGASETAIEARIGQGAELWVPLSCLKTDLNPRG